MKKLNQFFIVFALVGLLVVFTPIFVQANMGDFPACFGFVNYSDEPPEEVPFGLKIVELDYTIDGGEVVLTCLDEREHQLVIRIDADSDGQITVKVPRIMIFAIDEDCESHDLSIFPPLPDIENTPYSRIITLDFEKGTTMITFEGGIFAADDNVYQYCGVIYGYDSQYLTPKKQVDKSRAPENVRCNEGLQLIIKYNGSPACVKLETAEKLIERGWGTYN